MLRTALLLAAVASGCAPSAMQGTFSDPAPGAQMYAIDDAARSGNHAAIPNLVECLGSDDDLVRFNAIEALRQLTGQDLGYRFDDPYALRREAILRWQEWVRKRMQKGRAVA